jgi:hypothetical protein
VRFRSRSLAAAVALLGLFAGTASPKDPPKGKAAKAGAKADAVAKALTCLDEDVSTSKPDMNEQHRVFTTAVAGLDFLLDPTGGKGLRPDRVDACLETIGRYVDGAEKAFDGDREGAGRGASGALHEFTWSQTSWSLSACAIFLAECYARGTRKAVAAKHLRTIADLLARSQQPNGGWGHDRQGSPRIPELDVPMPGGGSKKMRYPATLLSVSNWATFALGVSKPVAGKRLDAVWPKVRSFYESTLGADGTYPYDPSQKDSGGGSDVTAAARTAGSYAALRAMGLKAQDPLLQRTAKYLAKHVADLPEGHGSAPHGVFFGAIASLSLGAEVRKEFEATVVPRILAAQDAATGAFDCICLHQGGTTCDSFANGHNPSIRMMGGDWVVWMRAYVNALNLFAVLCEKGKLRLLDGLPPDAGAPSAPTTPGSTPPSK